MPTYRNWLNGRPKRRRLASVETVTEHAEWLAKMWSVFAGISFAIAVGYWFEFRRVYAMPVAFGSSSALASLPALFGIVLLCNLVLAILLLGPSCALWMRVDSQGRRLIDGHRPAVKKSFLNPFRTSDLSRAWIVTQALAVAGALMAMSFVDVVARGLRPLLAMGAAAALFVSIRSLGSVRKSAGIAGRGAWISSACVIYATVLQCLAVTAIARFVFGHRNVHEDLSLQLCWIVWMICCLSIAGLQFLVAAAFRKRPTPVVVRCTTLLLAALPGLPLTVPTLAADMAAFAYQTSAPDGTRCVQLLASHQATKEDWAGLAYPGPVEQSVNLAYVAQLDGFQVKRTRDSDTLTVPADQVRGVTACQPEVGPLNADGAGVAGTLQDSGAE